MKLSPTQMVPLLIAIKELSVRMGILVKMEQPEQMVKESNPQQSLTRHPQAVQPFRLELGKQIFRRYRLVSICGLERLSRIRMILSPPRTVLVEWVQMVQMVQMDQLVEELNPQLLLIRLDHLERQRRLEHGKRLYRLRVHHPHIYGQGQSSHTQMTRQVHLMRWEVL